MNFLFGLLAHYTWAILGILIVVLYRIARFYQVPSGRRSYYRLFLVPLVLMLAGGLRYATLGIIVGDVWADLLMIVGGASLIVLGYYLLRLMTGGRS